MRHAMPRQERHATIAQRADGDRAGRKPERCNGLMGLGVVEEVVEARTTEHSDVGKGRPGPFGECRHGDQDAVLAAGVLVDVDDDDDDDDDELLDESPEDVVAEEVSGLADDDPAVVVELPPRLSVL